MTDLTQTYGEFTIAYNENTDQWIGSVGNNVIHQSAKLSDLKKALDKHGEKERKFTRVAVFKATIGYGKTGDWTEGEVTSVTDEGEIWVTWKDKSRSKESRRWGAGLFLLTPENLAARKLWDTLEAEIKSLQEEQQKLLKGMKTFKVKP